MLYEKKIVKVSKIRCKKPHIKKVKVIGKFGASLLYNKIERGQKKQPKDIIKIFY